MGRILLIEDDKSVRESLKRVLESEGGYSVQTAETADQGMGQVKADNFDVVITDLRMPGLNGHELLRQLHADKPHLPVILITAHHTTDVAIETAKLGAFDYVPKPIEDIPDFLGKIKRAVENKRLSTSPVGSSISQTVGDEIIGNGRLMQSVFKEIGRVAARPVTVLIRGETGTGKELVARALYRHSGRADQPFITVNCVAIPETLLESELFGHEAGAFTGAQMRRIGRFEAAKAGTIFLDEIGDMTVETQAKLLRVLQEKTFRPLGGKEPLPMNARVIAATHRDLEGAIRGKKFREDLYHRLNEVVINLPPLRERVEDLRDTIVLQPDGARRRTVGLVNYFIRRERDQLGSRCPELIDQIVTGAETSEELKRAADIFEELEKCPWPGNVRELRNVIRKALLLGRGFPINREIIRKALDQSVLARLGAAQTGPPRPTTDQPLEGYVAQLLAAAERGEAANIEATLIEWAEREIYMQAFRLAKGNQAKTVKWLGVRRNILDEKLERYGLCPAPDRSRSETTG